MRKYTSCRLIVVALLSLGMVTPQIASSPIGATAAPPAPLRKLTDPVPDPHQPGVSWFAPTGHTLRGSFLAYWLQYGGLVQFGYPLSEEFVEPVGPANTPLQVQYFERARFEHHPEYIGTASEVLLSALGRQFHAPDPPAAPVADARYFPATGHNLRGAFLAYWQSHGGLPVHGYPLSEPFAETNPTDGQPYTVQYFERARLELHPANAGTPAEVLLGLLGSQFAGQQGYLAGAYPRFGHAADFSWIAGQMKLFGPNWCSSVVCGCSILQYEVTATRVQLDGPDWFSYYFSHRVREGEFFVLFGYQARPTELFTTCPLDLNAPGYIVNQVRINPTS